MARRRREILKQLEEEGVLTLNKELEIPLLAQRIAVISSATAAGYGDFCNQLEQNPYGFVFYPRLFPAIMQGERVEQSVITALDAIHACRDDWDVVVIIRGGGATSDLSGFDTYELAANCAQFPIPIITGIGHERDDTVLDCVSHTRVKTPTAAAEYLINHLHDTAKVLEDYASAVLHTISTRMERENTRLNRMVERIPMQTRMRLKRNIIAGTNHKHLEVGRRNRLTKETHCLKMMETRLGIVSQRRLVKEKHRLQLFGARIETASPENLFEKDIYTLKNGKAVDASVSFAG